MVRHALAVAVLGMACVSCHTITEELPAPTATNPNAPGAIPVIVIPVPVLTPTPPPAPTPAPGGGPTPTPNPPPQGQGCGLPAGTGSGEGCPYEHASFQNDVETAIDNAIRNNPGLFDMRDNRCPLGLGCPRVLDSDGYWNAVTNEIRRLGYCAVNDGEELAVKSTNSWNDQYDIISGDGIVRRGAGAYRSTCHPAWF